jgi:membrane protease subunit HflK
MTDYQHSREDRQPHTGDAAEAMDPAGQSLAKALRASFRLLSAIMGLVLVLYLLSGVKSIQSYQVGIKRLFGRVVGVAEQGLAYVWPFPVGSIEIVDIRQQRLTVDDFWMHETPEEKTHDLLSRAGSTSLRPQTDGALLTGDRNLLHIRLACNYQVTDPRSYVANVGAAADSQEATPAAELVRSAICGAAIRAAAVRTADALQRTERDQFAMEVGMLAQQELDSLKAGVQISKVLLTNATWPIEALRTYVEAQNAVSEAEKKTNEARAEAEKILNAAAGASYRLLVGEQEQADASTQPADAAEAPVNLIGQYVKALESGDGQKARQLMERIDEVLVSNDTGGEASKIIAEARSYRTATIQRVKSRADRFNELLPEYRKTPELMLQRLWATVREDILNFPTVEKFYISPGGEKTVVRINRDPDVVKEILKELKAASKQPQTGQ